MVTTRSKATKGDAKIGVVPGSIYIKAWVAIMAVYSAQMLLIPGNMVTDHWDVASTPGMEFWIRGASVGFGCMAYLLTQVETAKAVQVATFASFAIGVLYPWNVKCVPPPPPRPSPARSAAV